MHEELRKIGKKDMDDLPKILSRLEKPTLKEDRKEALKAHIFRQINQNQDQRIPFSLQYIVDYVKEVVSGLEIGISERVNMKEHVFSYVESKKSRSYFWRNAFMFHKKLVSAFVLMFMVFSFMSFVRVDLAVVRAETFTTLDAVFGDVTVERAGEPMEPYQGMELFESDRVITGGDGFVTINYLDDSVSRLAANSILQIERLHRDEENPLLSYVEVDLQGGALWSKVLNLLEKDSAFVVDSRNVQVTTKKAAFNVEVVDEQVEVEVYNNVVEVKNDTKKAKVISGKKAVVEQDVEVVALEKEERNLAWIVENLESDREYLLSMDKRLLSARLKSLGINSDDELNTGNSFREDVSLFLTFDDVTKKKMELDLAEKHFIEAQVRLYDPDLTDEERAHAEELIISFSDEVKAFKALIDEVALTDQDYADELSEYLQKKVSSHKKDLIAVLPDSPLYEVKGIVGELEILVVTDENQKVDLKKNKALEKLSEAEDLASLGDKEGADKLVKEYKEDVEELKNDLKDVEDESVKEEVKTEVAESEDLLASIEAAVNDTGVEVEGETFDFPSEISEPAITEKYGVKVEGDKPLSPFLEF